MGHIGLVSQETFDKLIAEYNILARGFLCNQRVMQGPDYNPVTTERASHWYAVIGPKNG